MTDYSEFLRSVRRISVSSPMSKVLQEMWDANAADPSSPYIFTTQAERDAVLAQQEQSRREVERQERERVSQEELARNRADAIPLDGIVRNILAAHGRKFQITYTVTRSDNCWKISFTDRRGETRWFTITVQAAYRTRPYMSAATLNLNAGRPYPSYVVPRTLHFYYDCHSSNRSTYFIEHAQLEDMLMVHMQAGHKSVQYQPVRDSEPTFGTPFNGGKLDF